MFQVIAVKLVKDVDSSSFIEASTDLVELSGGLNLKKYLFRDCEESQGTLQQMQERHLN